MSASILIVEDEYAVARGIEYALKQEGYEVTVARNGEEGLEAATRNAPDLVILDVRLPGMDGFEMLRRVRGAGNKSPVLMLTARDEEMDKVIGLELGADDYLTKPFSIPELQARVKAMLRRVEMQSAPPASTNNQERIEAGGLLIDFVSREARLDGHPVPLTAREFDLLAHFARNPGRAFTRMQLLDAVWGTTFEGYEHNVNTHINRLRAKIEADPANPRYVLTVRGVGYRFTDER